MLTSKQKKASDPLSSYRERVEALDIKLSLDYVVDQTTHVIANKRNSAKNLQALINGQYVVTEAYVEALVNVTTARARTSQAESPAQAPLEIDFDGNWPDPLDYVPAAGREPVPRSANFYAPNNKRVDMFAGHTVVFLEQPQLENLQDVINNGGGKAVLYDVRADNSDVKDFVTFVNKLRPQKPIIVRFRGGEEEPKWKTDFQLSSQLALSQRSIDQNEFLDAIIMADTDILKLPLQDEIEIGSSLPPPRSLPEGMRSLASQSQSVEPMKVNSGAPQSADDQAMSPQEAPAQAKEPMPARRRMDLAPYKSRFTSFDDFDPSQIKKYVEDSDDDGDALVIDEISNERMAIDAQPTAATSRKRPHASAADSSDPMDTTDVLGKVTSANEKYKRRKLAAGGATEEALATDERMPPKPKNPVVEAMENLRRVREKREAGRDITDKDVKNEIAKMKARQAELEKDRLKQEENLRNQIQNADSSEIRALIQFEEMNISRQHTPSENTPEASDRWDDRWNGRKNFKKFRKVRRGDAANGQPLNQPRKVIVALEETRKKDFGLGEDYWLQSSSTRREGGKRAGEHVFSMQKGRSESRSQSQSQTQRGDGEDASQASRPGSRSQAKPAQDSRTASSRRVIEEEDSEPEDIELAEVIEPPRKEKLAEKAVRNETKAAGKRKSESVPLQQAATTKRRATTRATTRTRRGRAEDDSSDDDLRFKFRKRG